MSNPLIRASDHYVLLEPDSKEKIVLKQEAILWLKNWLSKTETQTIYQNIEDPDQEFFEELLERSKSLLFNNSSKLKNEIAELNKTIYHVKEKGNIKNKIILDCMRIIQNG